GDLCGGDRPRLRPGGKGHHGGGRQPCGGCPRGLLLLPGRHGLRLRHGLPRILCR
ncbi:hypothetical protein KMBAHK_KMBAHK_02010, partial [Dysosmobacter welbionis]